MWKETEARQGGGRRRKARRRRRRGRKRLVPDGKESESVAGINEGWGDEEQGDEGYKDGEREREREVGRSALGGEGMANTFLIKTVSRRN